LLFSAREGLSLDLGTVAACGLPVLLMLPIEVVFLALAAVLFLVVRTDSVLTAAEKERINTWCARKIRQLGYSN